MTLEGEKEERNLEKIGWRITTSRNPESKGKRRKVVIKSDD